jgi:hypothetical protein
VKILEGHVLEANLAGAAGVQRNWTVLIALIGCARNEIVDWFRMGRMMFASIVMLKRFQSP